MGYDMISLFTAIGLTPGGSSTTHIYTNNTQNDKKKNKQYIEQQKKYIEQHKNKLEHRVLSEVLTVLSQERGVRYRNTEDRISNFRRYKILNVVKI
jgi:4-diphosphocytidyl-2C-methyl-D-erythritol kinase